MRLFEMAVAIDQHHGFKTFNRSQRCKLQSYGHLDANILELSQTNLAHSIKQAFEADNIHRSFSTPCLPLSASAEEEISSNPRIEIIGGRGATAHALIVEVAISMASGIDPKPVSSGLGGAYVFHSQNGTHIAVAKPADEEPLAFNNPKGLGGRMLGQPGLKRSVRIGETGIRELAAYFLDHGGFAGVPPTALVKFCHAAFYVSDTDTIQRVPCKVASLQRFVDHDYDAGELSPSFFSVASVHQIGIFDIRLLNLDRHAGNMLVKKHDRDGCYPTGAAELVPIDHGLCLPEWMDDPYFEWLHWPQASIPFSESELEYISKLDPFKDAELLRNELPLLRESSIRILVVCTIFLKKAAAAGLYLADIGQMMTREFCGGEEIPSKLENICSQAKACMIPHVFKLKKSKEETEEEPKMLQSDGEPQDGYCEGLDLPQLLQTQHSEFQGELQVSKMPRISFAVSMNGLPEAVLPSMNGENDDQNSKAEAGNLEVNNVSNLNKSENQTEGGIARNMSFSSWNHNSEIEFGDLNQGEWKLFLETFKKLLPGLFKDVKSKN